jgi:zinc transporter ZupT
MITAVQTLLLVIDTGASAVFLWAYTAGNRWWTSRVGRALVGLGTCIGLIIGYATLKRLFGWPTIPWVGVAIDVSIAVVLVYLATMFVRERQVWRGRGQRARHGRASSDVEDKRTEGAP